jgi:beta-lactamase class D
MLEGIGRHGPSVRPAMPRQTSLLCAAMIFAVATSCERTPTSSPTTPASEPAPEASSTPALPDVALAHPGCFEIVALDGDGTPTRHEGKSGECSVPTVPASTFKIPHALVALQTGVVTDPDAMETWDGKKQFVEACGRDQSLRTAIQESCLWFFQRTAAKIGAERMKAELAKLDYGNAKVDGRIDTFWLAGGSLEVTPDEQLDFVVRMFDGKLTSIDRAHVATVESIMQSDLARWKPRVPTDFAMPSSSATLWAKTGTDEVDGLRMTWWMGAIEGPRGRFAFVSRVRDEGELGAMSPAVHEGVQALDRLGVL